MWCSVPSSDSQCNTREKFLNLLGLDSSYLTVSTLLKALSFSRFPVEPVESVGLTRAGSVFPISSYS